MNYVHHADETKEKKNFVQKRNALWNGNSLLNFGDQQYFRFNIYIIGVSNEIEKNTNKQIFT